MDFNPRAPRGAATEVQSVHGREGVISIPALLAEQRRDSPSERWSTANFNPRAPRGAATSVSGSCLAASRFQSPRSSRSSDRASGCSSRSWRHFNPRAPRGAATARRLRSAQSCLISIPALLAEQRPDMRALISKYTRFQSPRSSRSSDCYILHKCASRSYTLRSQPFHTTAAPSRKSNSAMKTSANLPAVS